MELFTKIINDFKNGQTHSTIANELFECVWPFCEAVNYFRKKLNLRCLIGFWIRYLISITIQKTRKDETEKHRVVIFYAASLIQAT